MNLAPFWMPDMRLSPMCRVERVEISSVHSMVDGGHFVTLSSPNVLQSPGFGLSKVTSKLL